MQFISNKLCRVASLYIVLVICCDVKSENTILFSRQEK